MDNQEYLLKRIIILEGMVRGISDIISLTATPLQLKHLNGLGREANLLSVKLDQEYKG